MVQKQEKKHVLREPRVVPNTRVVRELQGVQKHDNMCVLFARVAGGPETGEDVCVAGVAARETIEHACFPRAAGGPETRENACVAGAAGGPEA